MTNWSQKTRSISFRIKFHYVCQARLQRKPVGVTVVKETEEGRRGREEKGACWKVEIEDGRDELKERK